MYITAATLAPKVQKVIASEEVRAREVDVDFGGIATKLTPPEAKKSRVAGEDGQQEEGADEWVAEIAAIMRQEGAIPLSEVNRESLIWAPYHADMPRFKAALKIVCRSETRDGVRYIMVKENVLD